MKTSIVVVVVIVVLKNRYECVYIHVTTVLIGKGALDGKELFAIEGSKNWRSTPGQSGGARKMRQSRLKTPPTDI